MQWQASNLDWSTKTICLRRAGRLLRPTQLHRFVFLLPPLPLIFFFFFANNCFWTCRSWLCLRFRSLWECSSQFWSCLHYQQFGRSQEAHVHWSAQYEPAVDRYLGAPARGGHYRQMGLWAFHRQRDECQCLGWFSRSQLWWYRGEVVRISLSPPFWLPLFCANQLNALAT